MKILLIVLILIAAVICAALVWMSLTAKAPDAGLVDGRLRACPGTPNCVCSEYPDTRAFIRPFEAAGSVHLTWEALRRAVAEAGGNILVAREDYLRATFTSPVFRFVDDVEFRFSSGEREIHVRSASRAGRSDFGVNRRRVERLREDYRRFLQNPGTTEHTE